MSEIKADKRNFSGSCVPVGTARGKYLTSKFPTESINAIRNLLRGKDSSFPAPGLKEFKEGYELVGLESRKTSFSEFYESQGIDYVNGVINRHEDLGNFEIFSKSYREALRFRESYNSK